MTVVLLIDNQPLIGEGVRRMLAPHADITYHYCSHPAAAFDAALKVKPTVVLLDTVMGDFDGLALIKRFRDTPATAELPLVVLTAREDAKLKAEAFAGGANDDLVKFPDREPRGADQAPQRLHQHARTRRGAALAKELAVTPHVRSAAWPLRGRIKPWAMVSSRMANSFGYHWINDHHFAIYFLMLRAARPVTRRASFRRSGIKVAQATDFRDPSPVLWAPNRCLPDGTPSRHVYRPGGGSTPGSASPLCGRRARPRRASAARRGK
jgi:sigma-B regulation protein RsbU (phosphoserine phosphatase)